MIVQMLQIRKDGKIKAAYKYRNGVCRTRIVSKEQFSKDYRESLDQNK